MSHKKSCGVSAAIRAITPALMAFCSLIASAAEPLGTQPDAAIQTAMDNLSKTTDALSFNAQLESLVAGADRNLDTFVPQLLIYAAGHQSDLTMRPLVGRILKRIDASKEKLITILVPQLDNRDAAIRGITRRLLRGYEDRSAERAPDFSTYRAIIETAIRAGRTPQRSLVTMMYESDPATALQTMLRAYQLRDPVEIKSIRWAQHTVSDLLWRRQFGFAAPTAPDPAASAELEKLSHNDRWWARLYVAALISVHPELGNTGLIARLGADNNVLVRAWHLPGSTSSAPAHK